MAFQKPVLFFMAVALLSSGLSVSAEEARVVNHKSPNGKLEQCVALADLPGANYSKKDRKQEEEFCAIDLYSADVALCPKFWSTSAGTIVVSNAGTGLSSEEYEAQRCQLKDGHEKLAKFKTTMNASGTSATFSPSSLLYYHFSRYLDADVTVPVAVYRSIDKDAHYARVTTKAKGKGKMNIQAWKILAAAEKNPAAYKPVTDLFTPDQEQIYGIFLRDKGERYGAEFNGTRASGWGDGQNNDFQKTPAFWALRSEKSLEDAMSEGIANALQDPKVKADVGGTPISRQQMAFWMQEVTEITLLDYIFSQQDRIGNIDYVWTWYYSEGGKFHSVPEKGNKDLPRSKMAQIRPPAEIAQYNPVLLQRTSIGDNDAGGKYEYTNFTRRTKMLEKIRHYNANTYRKLLSLNEDLEKGGSISRWLTSSFRLSTKELEQIKSNTQNAVKILQQTCLDGKLQFDLNPKAYFAGLNRVENVNCRTP